MSVSVKHHSLIGVAFLCILLAGTWLFYYYSSNRGSSEPSHTSPTSADHGRLQILPNNPTVQIGSRVIFASFGSKSLIAPPETSWQAHDAGGNPVPISQIGEFQAVQPGVFKIRAVSSNETVETTVTVERRVQSPSVATIADSGPRLRPDDTGWDETNYESAFRPANHRGAPKAAGVLSQGLQSGGDRRDSPGSSNFQIVAPVISLPGRGMDLTLALTYNSNLWHLQDDRMRYDIDRDWPAPGWSLGFGKLVIAAGGNILYGPDGTRHRLTRIVDPADPGRFTGQSTGDGTFIDYYYYGDSAGVSFASVRYPSGLEVQYTAQGSSRSVIYPTLILDASGNAITVTFRNNTGPSIETVTDTLGRVVTFHYDANELLTAVSGPAGRSLARLHYTQRNIDPDFGRLRKDVPGNVWLIDAIYYPGTQRGYWFGDSDSYSSYGMIAKVSEQRQLRFSASSLNDQGDVRPNGVPNGNHPSAARNLDGRLEVAVRGANNGVAEQWQTAPNNGWVGTWGEFGQPLRAVGDPVLAQNADGRLERFVRGPNNVIHHMCQISPNNGWNAEWVPLGSQPMAGDVALERNAEGRLEAFARGTDGWLYQNWQIRVPRECAPERDWNNTWARMGSQQMAGDPAVARNVEGRLEVAARGADNRLYLTWQIAANGGWTNAWMPLGEERFVGNPAMARHSDGRLEVLVRGFDGIIYRKRQLRSRQEAEEVRRQCLGRCQQADSGCRQECTLRPPQERPVCFSQCEEDEAQCVEGCPSPQPDLSWTTSWVAVGSQRMAGNPVVVEGVNGRLTALARGQDGRIYRIRQLDPDRLGRRGWEEAWTPLGSEQVFGDPSAIMNADGRLEVFALGTDGAVYHIWQLQADGGWMPGWAPFTRQGIAGERLVARERGYDYPLGPASLSRPPTYTAMTEIWARMDTPPVTTRYAVEDLTGNLTITYADGTTVARTIDNSSVSRAGLPLWEVISNAQSQELLRITYAWQDGDSESPRLEGIVERDALGQSRRKEFRYGPRYNQLSDVRDYDYDGRLLRRTHTDYLNDPAYIENHIFNLPTATAVYQGESTTPVTLIENNYDTYDQLPLVDAPGVRMHSVTHNPFSGGELFDPRTLRRGNLTRVTRYADAGSRASPVTELRSYDITGNMIARAGTCCVEERNQFSRDYQYAYPTEFVRGDPNPSSSARLTSTATYDFNTGLLINTRDASARQTRRNYDPASLRLSSIEYPTEPAGPYNPQRRFEYAEGADLFAEGADLIVDESFVYRGNLASRTRTYLNGRGLPWRVSALAKDHWNAADTRYDARGRVSQQTLPFIAGDPSPPWQTFEYDALGRLTRTVAPDGTDVQRIVYNEPQRPERAQGRPGQTMRTIDAWGRERWTRADALDRLAEVIEPNPDGQGSVFEPGHASTRYYYNALDQVSEIEHGAQWHGYVYDSLGRLIRQRLPEKDWTLNEAGQFIGGGRAGIFSDVFAYDARGNLISHVDARGVRTINNYGDDPLNRLQEIRYDTSGFGDAGNPIVPASTARYYYMTTGDLTRLRAVVTDEVSEEYSYDQPALEDAWSRRSKVIRWGNRQNMPAQIDYTYDFFDRLTDIRYPAQTGLAGAPRSVVHVYFAPGGPVDQIDINGETLARPLSYAPNGSIRELSIGPRGSPVTETYDYDRSYGLLSQQRVSRQAGALLDLSYRYAGNGRVTGQVTGITSNLGASGVQNHVFDYDALGRLTTAYFLGRTPQDAWVQRYAYDNYGNRTQTRAFRCDAVEGCPSVPTAELPADWRDGLDGLTYAPESNRITTPGFGYDAAGNLRRGQRPDGSWQNYQYDAVGRLALVTDDRGTVLERTHYGDSRQRAWVEARIRGFEALRSTYYAWGGNQVLAEFTSEPATGDQISWARNYAYLGDRLLATQSPAGTRFHHPDRLGTRLITDATGAVVSQQDPFAFGTERESPSPDASKRRFTSYDRSEASGLDYAVNRYYDPGLGRFDQVDPLGIAANSLVQPQSLNMYSYTSNDPVNNIDPVGLLPRENPWECVDYEGERYCGEVITVTAPESGPLTPPNVPRPDPDQNAREEARGRGVHSGGGGGSRRGGGDRGSDTECSAQLERTNEPYDFFFFVGGGGGFPHGNGDVGASNILRAEREGIQVFGTSSEESFYTATIVATGLEFNVPRGSIYGAVYGGVEQVGYSTSQGWLPHLPADIILAEGGVGPVYSGAYAAGFLTSSSPQIGTYFGGRIGHSFFGVGTSLSPVQTEMNKWNNLVKNIETVLRNPRRCR